LFYLLEILWSAVWFFLKLLLAIVLFCFALLFVGLMFSCQRAGVSDKTAGGGRFVREERGPRPGSTEYRAQQNLEQILIQAPYKKPSK